MNVRTLRLMIAVTLSVAMWHATRQIATAEEGKIIKSMEDVLWWLPTDTETLLYARGPFPPPPPALFAKSQFFPVPPLSKNLIVERRIINGQDVAVIVDRVTGRVVRLNPRFDHTMVKQVTSEFKELKGSNSLIIHLVSHAANREKTVSDIFTKLGVGTFVGKKAGRDAALIRIPIEKLGGADVASLVVFAVMGWLVYP